MDVPGLNVLRNKDFTEKIISSINKLVKDIVMGKMATEIYKRAKKIHPIQNVDVWKTRVLNLPTIKLEDEQPPKPPAEKPEKEEKKTEEPVKAEA